MNAVERLRETGRLLRTLETRVIVVEGERDEAALRGIGINAPVIQATGSVERLVARVLRASRGRDKSVALLFDWDAEGRRKVRFFEARFRAEGESRVLDRVTPLRFKALLGVLFVEEASSKFSRITEEGMKWERRTLIQSST